MRHRWLWLLMFPTLLLVAPPDARGQSDSLTNMPPSSTLYRDGVTAVGVTTSVLSAPARWKGSNWLAVGGVVALTGGAVLLDGKMYSIAARNRSAGNDRIEKIVILYGEGAFAAAFIAGLYGVGLVFEDDWTRETAVLAGAAVVLSGVVAHVVKPVVGRARPYTGRDHLTFDPFTWDPDFNSFPSGHTVVAFSLSAVVAERIGNVWASIGLYTLAGMTSLSRMYSDNHWFSDVVFSAAFATAVGHSVVRWFENRGEGSGETGLHIFPSSTGITIAWSF